ncbi:Vms1/Ankzf1 family peptidyl-tRNA hydrolase [Pseudofrankia sp. BMG5.36]|uniref:baeRF2 domain-containing protein n=1 Tax=Pseudofrankia sp. BMG5.36 TaxID=1834512 RepID=UPI000A863453|nr:Vms1/Ankzf1 family peptidyl-tRNA hydrolase [Pseudofrankia sp. BMG5.36]
MTALVTADMNIGRLIATTGPIATLYLGMADNLDDIEHERALRWRGLRDRLAAEGTDDATLAALDETVHSVGPTDVALAAFAADGRVVSRQQVSEQLGDRGMWAQLPCALPLLAYEQRTVPCVVALADRTGADLRVEMDGSRIFAEVEGTDDEIERNAPGGWSQRRYQDRAEDSWAHNAAQVAEAVTRLTEQVNAAAVALGGDSRAVQLVREHLPPRVSPLVHQLEHGSRHPSRGGRKHEQEVRDLVGALAQSRTVELLGRLAEDRAHGRAVEGTPATLAALSRSQVGTLLVVDDPGDDRVAWFGPDPTDVAAEPATLASLVGSPSRGRLADVAVRAALGTGATVHVLSPDLSDGPTDGLAGLLRYPRVDG